MIKLEKDGLYISALDIDGWLRMGLSYALHKSDNPLKFASVANIIYIHNLSVCFAKCL